jgi:hypothetical protein
MPGEARDALAARPLGAHDPRGVVRDVDEQPLTGRGDAPDLAIDRERHAAEVAVDAIPAFRRVEPRSAGARDEMETACAIGAFVAQPAVPAQISEAEESRSGAAARPGDCSRGSASRWSAARPLGSRRSRRCEHPTEQSVELHGSNVHHESSRRGVHAPARDDHEGSFRVRRCASTLRNQSLAQLASRRHLAGCSTAAVRSSARAATTAREPIARRPERACSSSPGRGAIRLDATFHFDSAAFITWAHRLPDLAARRFSSWLLRPSVRRREAEQPPRFAAFVMTARRP